MVYLCKFHDFKVGTYMFFFQTYDRSHTFFITISLKFTHPHTHILTKQMDNIHNIIIKPKESQLQLGSHGGFDTLIPYILTTT